MWSIKFNNLIKLNLLPLSIRKWNNFLLFLNNIFSSKIIPFPIVLQSILLLRINFDHTSGYKTTYNLPHILFRTLEEELLDNLRISKLSKNPFSALLIPIDIWLQYIKMYWNFSSIFRTNKSNQEIRADQSKNIQLIILSLSWYLFVMKLSL